MACRAKFGGFLCVWMKKWPGKVWWKAKKIGEQLGKKLPDFSGWRKFGVPVFAAVVSQIFFSCVISVVKPRFGRRKLRNPSLCEVVWRKFENKAEKSGSSSGEKLVIFFVGENLYCPFFAAIIILIFFLHNFSLFNQGV